MTRPLPPVFWLLSAVTCIAGGCQDAPAPAAPQLATSRTAPQTEPARPSGAAGGGTGLQAGTTAVEGPPQAGSQNPDPPPSTGARPADDPTAAASRRARAPGKVRELTFDDVKFEMQKDEPFLRSMLTPEIEALHGVRIRIRGYMYPSFQQSGLTQFVLVRDNMECCFGPGAALYDCIYVEMEPGKSTDYYIRPVSVEGEFHIREWVLDGKHLAIFHMTASAVR